MIGIPESFKFELSQNLSHPLIHWDFICPSLAGARLRCQRFPRLWLLRARVIFSRTPSFFIHRYFGGYPRPCNSWWIGYSLFVKGNPINLHFPLLQCLSCANLRLHIIATYVLIHLELCDIDAGKVYVAVGSRTRRGHGKLGSQSSLRQWKNIASLRREGHVACWLDLSAFLTVVLWGGG